MPAFARNRRSDAWFCLPVVTAMVADAAVSLACQPAAYWADPVCVHEGNPAWGALLAHGPLVFVAGFVVYVALIVGILIRLTTGVPQKLLGMFVLLAHSYGAASWLYTDLPSGAYWWALIGLFAAEAAAFAVYWGLSDSANRRSAPAPEVRSPDSSTRLENRT